MILEFMLAVSILIPGQAPDLVRRVPMDTLDHCLEMARTYMESTTIKDAKDHGGYGYSASCAAREKAGSDT